jgi:hypothetical protein
MWRAVDAVTDSIDVLGGFLLGNSATMAKGEQPK